MKFSMTKKRCPFLTGDRIGRFDCIKKYKTYDLNQFKYFMWEPGVMKNYQFSFLQGTTTRKGL